MRLSVAIPAVVLIIATAAIGLASVAGGQAAAERRRLDAIPRTGMDILNAHDCGGGETKQILVLGVEDNFSPAGSEAGFVRPGRGYQFYLPRDGAGEYDQVNADLSLADSFKVEGAVSGGVFVIRRRGLNEGGSDNDGVVLGALRRDPHEAGGAWMGGFSIYGALMGEGWSVEGDSIYANLDDIALSLRGGTRGPADGSGRQPVQSLGDYLNQGGDGGWLDVSIGDDTAVDFMGLALCRPPPVRKGVTLRSIRPPGPEQPQHVHLSCHHTRGMESRCNPYVGDTVCSARLQVACLKPGDLPVPLNPSGGAVSVQWSGGDIAVTEPVRGDRFRTVRDVDALCARRFGGGWRVATLHDGGRIQSVAGRGDPASVSGRVWADIADQPHATCWARE